MVSSPFHLTAPQGRIACSQCCGGQRHRRAVIEPSSDLHPVGPDRQQQTSRHTHRPVRQQPGPQGRSRRAQRLQKVGREPQQLRRQQFSNTSRQHAVQTAGGRHQHRTAAGRVKVVGGITDIPLLQREDMVQAETHTGGVVVVGSHTKKTTAQLNELLALPCVEPIAFNKGFYTVDVKYFYKITAEAYCGLSRPKEICGLATYDKRTVLLLTEILRKMPPALI